MLVGVVAEAADVEVAVEAAVAVVAAVVAAVVVVAAVKLALVAAVATDVLVPMVAVVVHHVVDHVVTWVKESMVPLLMVKSDLSEHEVTTPHLSAMHRVGLCLSPVPMVLPVLMEASVKSVLVVVHSALVHAVVPLVVAVAASVAVLAEVSQTNNLLFLLLLVEMMVVMIHLRHHPEVARSAACVSVTHLLAALPLVVVVEHKVHAAHYALVAPLEDLVVADPVVV